MIKNTLRNISSLSLLLLGSLSFADTMYENASDGDTVGWHIYDRWPSGVTVENVNDEQRGRVIKITGTTSNGVHLLGWEDTNSILQWKMKANKWNIFYVAVMTTNGFRYLAYTPRNYDKGRDPNNQSYKIRLGIGSKMMDGKWHTFTRDIQADITKHEPGNQLEYIQGIKIRGAGSYDDIKTIEDDGITNPVEAKSIFIIGPSTVHAGGYTHDSGPLAGARLEGWGEELGVYAKDSSKIINRARSGSNPVTYVNSIGENTLRSTDKEGRWWPDTLSRIQNRSNKNGGFLLIQFGGTSSNDKFAHWSKREAYFKEHVSFFITEAQNENLTPVLISPLSRRVTDRANRAFMPKYMHDLANEKGLLFLDLYSKSFNEYKKTFESVGLTDTNTSDSINFINALEKIYSYERNTPIVGGINNTHLSPAGARIVAGWVKDLACESDRADGQELCSQFK